MISITTALGLASSVLVALGYAARVTAEHDRLVDDDQWGTAPRRTGTVPAQAAAEPAPVVSALPVGVRVPALV
jgi:hypothetical protein